MPIQLKRGLEADLIGENLLESEPAYTLDTKRLMVGDGEGGVTRIPTGPEVSAEIASAIAILRRGTTQSGPFSSIPSGALELMGQTVSRTTYAALWAYVQANYEVLSEADWNSRKGDFSVGNGTTTFRLPDMRGRVAVGYQSGDAEFGTMGKTGGHKSLQSHNHTGTATAVGDHTHLRGSLVGASGGQYSTQSGSTLSFGLGGETSVGGGHGHSLTINTAGTGDSGNLQPYAVWRYIIWY